jgi:hypothetical protein
MEEVVIEKVYRKPSGKIYGYSISCERFKKLNIKAEELKKYIKTGKMKVSNYKLTSDDRLILVKNKVALLKRNIYLLMNKNTKVAKFEVGTNRLEVYDRLPYDCVSIESWIRKRAKFSCASRVEEFFKSIGIRDTADFVEVTHCVSLHDTFWIKRLGDSTKWEMVSPYRNDYSHIISAYALEGYVIGVRENNYLSPDIATEGSFPHTWKFNGGNITFVKASSKYTLGGINSGRETFSEYYASKVATYLGFDCVKYNIRNHTRIDTRKDVVTECKCYTNEKIGTVNASSLGLSSYEDVITYSGKMFGDSGAEKIVDMLFLDCLILNTDRHFGNIEFFMNNRTLEIVGVAPIFDNNNSLLPRFIEGYEEFNRKEYLVRDGRTFEELYGLVRKYKNYEKELIRLREFRFERPNGVEITDERLNFLNNFLQAQVDYLLRL